MINNDLDLIKTKIKAAALRVNRDPETIKLLAVSKKQPVLKINEYLSLAFQNLIGENYIQEFESKKSEINFKFQSHLIGHLQSNKVKSACSLFDVIQSVDSLKLARLINSEALKLNKIQEIYLQVNISEDLNKTGIDKAGIFDLVKAVLQLKNLNLSGLMTITKVYAEPELARSDFKSMLELKHELELRFSLKSLELSMGMSDDFEVAIESGSTMIRLGTAIFGERN